MNWLVCEEAPTPTVLIAITDGPCPWCGASAREHEKYEERKDEE